MEENIVIGIDVGSTSVKVGVYMYSTDSLSEALEIFYENYPTDAFETLESHGYHQMNFSLVLRTIQKCVQRINYTYRTRAKKLAICGQMHGIIFWKEGGENNNDPNEYFPWKYDPISEEFKIDHQRFSSYITWQDTRCTQRFIENLLVDNHVEAEMEKKDYESTLDASCGHLSSGFGLTTAMWFSRNDKHYLYRFNRCGTPMTIILQMLLSHNATLEDTAILEHGKENILSDLERSRHSYAISDQIAASWGFYNLEKSSWLLDSMKRLDLAVRVDDNDKGKDENCLKLPRILPAGTTLGFSRTRWLLLPRGIELLVECGDMQCSTRVSLIHRSKAAIMNVSTSAQMAILLDSIPDQHFINKYPSLNILPYTNRQYVLVAASLNGGRVLQKYVEFLHDVVLKFAKPNNSKIDDIWRTLLEQNNVSSGQQVGLIINPTIFGERYDPTLTGSVSNIKSDNFTTSDIMSSLCYGIIQNILSMMPVEILKLNNIQQVICVGSVIQKIPIMRSIIEMTFKQFDIRVNFLMTADSQEGAALSALEQLETL